MKTLSANLKRARVASFSICILGLPGLCYSQRVPGSTHNTKNDIRSNFVVLWHLNDSLSWVRDTLEIRDRITNLNYGVADCEVFHTSDLITGTFSTFFLETGTPLRFEKKGTDLIPVSDCESQKQFDSLEHQLELCRKQFYYLSNQVTSPFDRMDSTFYKDLALKRVLLISRIQADADSAVDLMKFNFIAANRGSNVSAFELLTLNGHFPSQVLSRLYDSLYVSVQKSKIGRLCRQEIVLHTFPIVGTQVCDFDGPAFNGKEFALSNLKGRFVLLTFWASYCSPCLIELNHFKRIDSPGMNKFEIVAVSIDKSIDTWRSTVRANGLEQFHNVYWSNSLRQQFGFIDHLPTTIIINPNKKIVWSSLESQEVISQRVLEAVLNTQEK